MSENTLIEEKMSIFNLHQTGWLSFWSSLWSWYLTGNRVRVVSSVLICHTHSRKCVKLTVSVQSGVAALTRKYFGTFGSIRPLYDCNTGEAIKYKNLCDCMQLRGKSNRGRIEISSDITPWHNFRSLMSGSKSWTR